MIRLKQAVLNFLVIVTLMLSVMGVAPLAAATDNVTNPIASLQFPSSVQASHRLIVELTAAPLAVYARSSSTPTAFRTSGPAGHLDVTTSASQAYIGQLKSEQAAFVNAMRNAIPTASVATYLNENKQAIPETYQI